jgi:C-terminal processing protease CtpA/Prc
MAGAETFVGNPKGLNPNTKLAPPKDFNSEKPFSVKELLSQLGVEVVSENGKWKVKNVSQNSAAERSGLKADDIIETLDGKKLSGSSVRGKKIEVKKLGVKRGDAQVEINLQTNPK